MTSRVTIVTVAKRASVSPSTVSHVLSGKRTISPKVCGRVRRVIDELGYQANPMARGLVSRKTMQIGVIIKEISNNISSLLIEEIEEWLRKYGYKILLGISRDDKELAKQYIRDFASGIADGIINMVGAVSAQEAAREARGVPVVTYMRPVKESPVYVDHLSGAILAMEHLWTLGHRRIGFISLQNECFEEQAEGRELGFRQFHVRMRAELDETLIAHGNNRVESGYQNAEALYIKGATAIFAANDMMALGVLQWANQNRIRVPDDLSVVGFDDIPIALAMVPPLTTVQVPVSRLAEKTVLSLIWRINRGEPMRQEVIVPHLVVRGTTAKAKYENGKRERRRR